MNGEGPGGRAGFTLIEAVIAVAIMSVSAFALLSSASRCLAVAQRARNLHAAAAVRDRGELEHPLLPTNDVLDNEVAPVEYDKGFWFSRTVEPLGAEEDLWVIRTRVLWSTKGRETFDDVETLLYTTNHPAVSSAR